MPQNKNNSSETGVFVSNRLAVAIVVLLVVLVVLNLLLCAQMYRMPNYMYSLYDVMARIHNAIIKMRVY